LQLRNVSVKSSLTAHNLRNNLTPQNIHITETLVEMGKYHKSSEYNKNKYITLLFKFTFYNLSLILDSYFIILLFILLLSYLETLR